MAEKVLKALVLNFETVTGARIPAEYIESFAIEGVTKEICMYPHPGDKICRERQMSKYFRVALLDGANHNVEYYPDFLNKDKEQLFDYLCKAKNICSVTFEYEGGFSEEIWVNWFGTGETNKLQKTYWTGDWRIVEIGQKQERYE